MGHNPLVAFAVTLGVSRRYGNLDTGLLLELRNGAIVVGGVKVLLKIPRLEPARLVGRLEPFPGQAADPEHAGHTRIAPGHVLDDAEQLAARLGRDEVQ